MMEWLVRAVKALGAVPEGYCFCASYRIGNDSKKHDPECAELRAALAAAEPGVRDDVLAPHTIREIEEADADRRAYQQAVASAVPTESGAGGFGVAAVTTVPFDCLRCCGERWVCEEHDDVAIGCCLTDCGISMPCPDCNPSGYDDPPAPRPGSIMVCASDHYLGALAGRLKAIQEQNHMITKLYTKPGCGPCLATKNAMTSRGIPFDVVDVSNDDAALKVITDLGYRSVPVVVVSTDRHWGGEFRLDLITDLAAELRAEIGE